MKKFTVNSFFTGIGGFDLGFESQGFKVEYQCENNAFCESILKNQWEDVQYGKSIVEVDPQLLPSASVWCAGFPCQDVSVARGANGRDGLKGKNSGLFYEFLRLITERKPEVILLENVLGLLSSHKGNDFKIILQSLTELGYGVSWRVFNSRFFGVPQSRQRVFICAWKDNINKAAYVLHEQKGSVKRSSPRKLFITPQSDELTGVTVPSLAYCLAATSGRHTGTDWSRTYISYTDRVRRLIPSEAEALQGFPQNWTIPKKQLKKPLDADYDSLRYHAIGNAVSVPVIKWISKRIKEMLNSKCESNYERTINSYQDFSKAKGKIHETDLNETFQIKWNTGGLAFGKNTIDCKVHESPSDFIESKLIDVICKTEVNERFYLSPTAARGILRRVQSQNRVLFLPLANALEQLAQSDLLQAAV